MEEDHARQWGWMLDGLNVIGGITGAVAIAYLVEAFGPEMTTTHPS